LIPFQKSGKSSRPSTPKIDENNQRESGSPLASVLADGALPRLKIKAPKPDNYNACSPKNTTERLKCELDSNLTSLYFKISFVCWLVYLNFSIGDTKSLL